MRCITLTVLSLLVAVTAFAATPPLGREVPVSGVRYGEPVTEKWSADIATDGESYFAVYTDRRNELYESVYGTRISAEGQVLDPAGIAFGPGDVPSIVWNGEAYVVVWRKLDSLWAAKVTDGRVTASRIGPAGCGGIETASNGRTVLVLTCDRNAFLLDRDLTVAQQFQFAEPLQIWPETGIAAASRGEEYLIASVTSSQRVITQRLDASGMLHAGQTLPDVVAVSEVDLASNEDGWYLVLMRGSRLLGQVIDPSGIPTGPARELALADLSIPWPRGAMTSPAVAWRGSEYVVTYARGDNPAVVQVTRVSRAGEPSGTHSEPLAREWRLNIGDLVVRSDGSGAVIWVSFYDFRVEVALFDANSVGTAHPFTKRFSPATAAHEQVLPAIEPAGTSAVMAWVEQSFGVSDIRLSRPGGPSLLVASNTGVRSFDPNVVQQGWIDVAWDGSTVWVMWFGNGKAGIRRYTRELVPIDAQPLLFDAPPHAITVMAGTAGGGAAALVFETREPITTLSRYQALDVYQNPLELVAKVFRATDAGVALVGDVEVTDDAGEAAAAVAVWDGARFFVAWRETGYLLSTTFIRAVHVTPDGRRVESMPLWLVDTARHLTRLVAAPSPQGIVLAWDEVAATAVARYAGPSVVVPHYVPTLPENRLAAVAPLANGEVDLYWWKGNFLTASIRYERLPESLISNGDAYVTPEFPVKNQAVQLDAVVLGTTPLVVHSRIDDAPEVGGTVRLFLRQTAQVRRRAVR